MIRRESCDTKMQILNRDVVKYIAMVTMLLNHIALIFLPVGSWLAELFTDIGYFTAPTMCFFLAEGYEYTQSKRKYGLRLLLFAILSQIPFALAFEFGNLNMIFTLLCCFLILVIMDRIQNPLFRMALCVLMTLTTVISDWALLAPIYTVLFRNSRGNRRKLVRSFAAAYVLFVFFNFLNYTMRPEYTAAEALALDLLSGAGIIVSAVVILLFYNGKRAGRGRTFSKWFFYLFYPGHLLLLYLIKLFAMG